MYILSNRPDATTVTEAVRFTNLHPHRGAHVIRRKGEGFTHTPVKNLGWLLRQGYNGELVKMFHVFRPIIPGTGDAVLVAEFENGTAYGTMFADRRVLAHWLNRPTFRDVPINWSGVTKPE